MIEKDARQVYELLTTRSTRERGETAPQRQERIAQAEAALPAATRGLSQTILAPVAAELGKWFPGTVVLSEAVHLGAQRSGSTV